LTTWDVFHSDRLEIERGLDSSMVRDAMARGDLTEDDLIRPAGSGIPWQRLSDRLAAIAALPTLGTEPDPQTESSDYHIKHDELEIIDEDPDDEPVNAELSEPAVVAFADDAPEILDAEILDDESPLDTSGPILPPLDKSVAIPVPGPAPLPWDEEELEAEFDGEDEYDPLEEDEAVAEFTLARGATQTVEELDLAAMVDVAFQLVLFFLVTATTVLYKSLEVPKPNADAPPDAATQGRAKTLDDLKADYILVEMDVAGAIKIDRQAVPGNLTMMALAEKLRTLRTDTGRTAMLFSADYNTPHRKAILAYDAANEIGLTIKTAKPTGGALATPPAVIKKG